MRFLRLTLEPDLVSPSPAVFRGEVLDIQYVPDGTIMELYAIEGDIETILQHLETDPNTLQYEHLGTEAGRYYIFHVGHPSEEVRELVELLEAYHLMVVTPFSFDDAGGVSIEVIGEFESLQAVYERFSPAVRERTTIEQVGEYVPARSSVLSVLTQRQREILDAAVAVGYYATPRTGTAEDIAELVGCAPSTASEHLRKLETRVFTHLVAPEPAR